MLNRCVCVCVYASANNFAMQHKRKTISGQDVLDAMKEMEFERFVQPLKHSLEGMKFSQLRCVCIQKNVSTGILLRRVLL